MSKINRSVVGGSLTIRDCTQIKYSLGIDRRKKWLRLTVHLFSHSVFPLLCWKLKKKKTQQVFRDQFTVHKYRNHVPIGQLYRMIKFIQFVTTYRAQLPATIIETFHITHVPFHYTKKKKKTIIYKSQNFFLQIGHFGIQNCYKSLHIYIIRYTLNNIPSQHYIHHSSIPPD